MPASPLPHTPSRRPIHRRRRPPIHPAWCCSFRLVSTVAAGRRPLPPSPPSPPSPPPKLPSSSSRRTRSPGRVSPIDSDASDPFPTERRLPSVAEAREAPSFGEKAAALRVWLKGTDGQCVVLEPDLEVLCDNSAVFAELVHGSQQKGFVGGEVLCREIEVDGLHDFDAFKETIELMDEKDEQKWLMRAGVGRAIGILEVSFSIMFGRGVATCLKYLEAVPWTESEEEKLKNMFAWYTFDEGISRDTLARVQPEEPTSSSNLVVELMHSITNGTHTNARKQMQLLLNGLLSGSSIYWKDNSELNKESMFDICRSCLDSLVMLFEEASGLDSEGPLVSRICKQVENLNWLLEVLIDKQMAEEFVDLWAGQERLVRLHEGSSPIVRYEVSRVSAAIFMAMGRGNLHCHGDRRFGFFQTWFGPMLADFGWLRRCSKGLDIGVLEDSIGWALLTLTLKQQQSLFMEWVRVFSRQGRECPNLSKAFQVWWRRASSHKNFSAVLH